MISDSLKATIAEIVSKRPGFEDVKLEDLNEAIEKAAIQVSRYCRLKVIPDEMKYLVADIVADVYKMDHYSSSSLDEDDFSNRVKKLTQGDTTIELETEAKVVPFSSMREILTHYQSELIVYRGIFWR